MTRLALRILANTAFVVIGVLTILTAMWLALMAHDYAVERERYERFGP